MNIGIFDQEESNFYITNTLTFADTSYFLCYFCANSPIRSHFCIVELLSVLLI